MTHAAVQQDGCVLGGQLVQILQQRAHGDVDCAFDGLRDFFGFAQVDQERLGIGLQGLQGIGVLHPEVTIGNLGHDVGDRGVQVERGLAAGASAVDATYSGDRSTTVQVRLGELEQVSDAEGESISLRLFDRARSASVASSDFSEEVLSQLVERCMGMAREAPEDPYAGLAPAELLETAPPSLELGDLLEPDPENLRARALAAEAAALAVPGIANSTGSGAMTGLNVVAFATSGGFAGAYRSGNHGCLAGVIAGEGAAMQRDHAWHSVRYLEDLARSTPS